MHPFSLPSYTTLADGEVFELDFTYYLPISGPSSYTVKINGTEYAFLFEYPNAPLADLSTGGGGGTGGTTSCEAAGVDPATVNAYPNWTQGTFATGGDQMSYQNSVYQAKWWTTAVPGSDDSWELVCSY